MTKLDPDSIAHIRQTWEIVEAAPLKVSGLFYDNVFIADPTLVALFGENMSKQGDKLMQMLRFAVQELDNPERFRHVFRELGKRHVKYGVQNEHYKTVGEALLKTLAQCLGDRFSPEVRDAWASFYGLMAGTMMSKTKARAL